MRKPATTDYPIQETIRERWSPRAVDSKRDLEPEKIFSLLEAARWAPSSWNAQPWRVLIFSSRDPKALEQARSCLVEGNSWARKAPVLLLTVACENFEGGKGPNRHAQYDTGQAAENICLQATALGLMSHQMAGYDAGKAVSLFKIPQGHTPMAMMAVGYPGKAEDLPGPVQEAEKAPRERKGLSEIAFAGTWGGKLR